MAEVKSSHIKQEDDTPAEQQHEDQQVADHAEQQPEEEAVEQGDQMEGIESEQYDQQYEQEEYQQQYEGDVQMYEEQGAEYAQDGSLAYTAADVAADAAEAVASVIAAGDAQAEYDGQQEYDAEHHAHSQAGGEQYDQEYMDENGHAYAEQEVDDQTLAAHPATSREMQAASSMVDADHHAQHGMSSEVSQAMNRYDFSSNPDGLQTLAATSSAVTQHSMHTPTKVHMHTVRSPSYSDQKQMMPKFNRARNWSVEETKILLAELERIVTSNPDERRENVLRSHSTFEEIADVLRDKGYANRDGQGCMIRWRNLLRVYKQTRANIAEGKSPGHHPNLQYAPAIESIYRFPPDGMHFSVSEASPGIESTPGNTRTWSQANGYETPARKRAREISAISEHLEHVDAKIDQSIEYLSQHSDLLRLLEERLARAEDALKQSEATIADLHNTISEKDAKREELQNQLMVTVQALSQVIATKKGEEQLSPQPQQLSQ
ncbi:hypothetical protein IWW36_000049 [Coemansia brasiliensis]|uniref:Myb-like domain-containing protein n=1 Tax=Coemansia brasiliensis TaxID=2650707 RepID=A0A9W8IBT0_9FUNG|nr:hypothetical protein IWW36_000049 [Coemansia brasiliensis]